VGVEIEHILDGSGIAGWLIVLGGSIETKGSIFSSKLEELLLSQTMNKQP
jgi:hypothetical protein